MVARFSFHVQLMCTHDTCMESHSKHEKGDFYTKKNIKYSSATQIRIRKIMKKKYVNSIFNIRFRAK